MTTCRFCDDPSCSGTAGCEGPSGAAPDGRGPGAAPDAPGGDGDPAFRASVFLPSGSTTPDPAVVAAFDQERIRPSGAPEAQPEGTPDAGGRAARGTGRLWIVAAVLIGATATAAFLLYPDQERRDTASPTRTATRVPTLPRATAPTVATSPTSHRPSHSARPSATRSPKAGHKGAAPTASKSPKPTPTRAPGPAAYAYVGVRSGLCVDVPYQEGMQLRLAPCSGSSGQKFTYTDAGELRVYGDTCVTAMGTEGALGTPVVIASCGGGDRQRWQLEGDGTIRQHGTCVDAFNGYSDPGTPLQMWECAVSTNQQWTRAKPSA
ncbi:ricin-type beta-trefoil lectin domain protein [Streptomyces sp. NA02950]|uniref:RICIN domain-containing protein n=1 Tax=Streptomyces sp. NA02950 TaxID=2742137 RepID=UPI001590106A|nr:RICIN domain-containing protein [Streptomyces sp. NA02950]QKV96357.1 ricin-type beta-trefoil lectin domain protein [Streptomyces sp. NA02950]